MKTHYILATTAAMALAAGNASAVNVAINGGFETGDDTGWTYLPTATSTFAVTGDSNTGSFAGELFNDQAPSSAVIQQNQVGAGVVTPGATVNISFWAKGSGAVGGVSFAELFSINGVGGVTKSELLGGAPLNQNNDYQFYSFTTTAGPDVTNGLTLQFTATTGAAVGSESLLILDDVEIDVVPEPSSSILIGSGLGLFLLRRRRRA